MKVSLSIFHKYVPSAQAVYAIVNLMSREVAAFFTVHKHETLGCYGSSHLEQPQALSPSVQCIVVFCIV